MAYNDLNTIKKINGIPVDLNYFIKITENDAFLKSLVDADEDLTALDRSILPVADDLYSLGLASFKFSQAFIRSVTASMISLDAGSLIAPSLKIGSIGVASQGNNEISLVNSLNSEFMRFMTSGLLVKAANNTQIRLDNTADSSGWSLGCDAAGFQILDNILQEVAVLFSTTNTSIYKRLRVTEGTLTNPGLSFIGDPSTGMTRDSSTATLQLIVSGINRLALSATRMDILSQQLIVPSGTAEVPGLTFSGYESLGIIPLDSTNVGFSIGGNPIHSFGELGTSSVHELDSSSTKTIYSDINCHRDIVARAHGEVGLPTPIQLDQDLHTQTVKAYTDTGWQNVSEVAVRSVEDFSTGSYGTSMTFSTVSLGETELSEKLTIGDVEKSAVHLRNIGLTAGLYNVAGTGLVLQVKDVSKVVIDATSGNIEIAGFSGGQEGQMLYIYKRVPTNTLTILFDSVTATQKVLLKGSTNYVNTNDYGGITLSFDEGVWREVSRS